MVNDTNHTQPYKTYEECQKNLPDLAFISDNLNNKIKHTKLEKSLPPFNKTIARVNGKRNRTQYPQKKKEDGREQNGFMKAFQDLVDFL